MANKTARTNGARQRVPVRKTVAAKKPRRAESWKKVFERNLIQNGFSSVEAKEIVELAAS